MHVPRRPPNPSIPKLEQILSITCAQPQSAVFLRENGEHEIRRRRGADGITRQFAVSPTAQPAATRPDPHRSLVVLTKRKRRAHGIHQPNRLKMTLVQTNQSAMVRPKPYSSIAALVPRAHTIAGQPVGHRKSLKAPIGCHVKHPVAVMIQPKTSREIFVDTHG